MPENSTNQILEAALVYAAKGYPVFPVHTPIFKDGKLVACSCNNANCVSENNVGKHPRTLKGLKAATTNREQIQKWWSLWPAAGIGITTGKLESGKHLVVVDIDTKNNGTENWNNIVESHPKLPETAESITGSGGKHILFLSDIAVKNSVGLIAPGIDVRGSGGYIVAPPSLHKSGKCYAWELSSDLAEVPIAPIPDWLLSLTGPKHSGPKPLPVDENGKILEGKRNDTLFSFGRAMRAKNADHSVILAALLKMNENQCDPPLDPKSVEIISHQVCAVQAGLSADIKEKIKKSEDEKAAQKKRAADAKEEAKKAEAKAKAEAMKASVEDARRNLRLVMHDFLAGSESMEDPAARASKPSDQSEQPADASDQPSDSNSVPIDSSTQTGNVGGGNNHPADPPSDDGDGSDGFNSTLSRGDSVELASLILREMRGRSSVPLVYDRQEFWYYNQHTGIWSIIEREIFSRRIALYAGTLINDSPLHLSTDAINQAIRLASDFVSKKEYFNTAPTGILFKNGFVVVKDGVAKLLPHSPEHRAIYRFEFDYDPSYKPAAWLEFLDQVFTLPSEETLPPKEKPIAAKDREDRIAFLQEHAGASLMGEATKYGVCAVLYGETASNGKSVYLDVIKAIFPTGSVISLSLHDWTNRFFLAELAGARLNVVDELPAKEISESESFKSIVTGGHIMVARKNQRPFNLAPNAGHIFACNTLPGTKDQTDGFWRRFTVVMFSRKFDEKDRELGLAQRLIQTDLAGIAVWAIQGLARLQKNRKYTIPASSAAIKEEWQFESDQVKQWIEECTIKDENAVLEGSNFAGRMTPGDAYTSYAYWVKVTGHGVGLSQQKFWKRLLKCCDSQHTKFGRLYQRRIIDKWTGLGSSSKHPGVPPTTSATTH